MKQILPIILGLVLVLFLAAILSVPVNEFRQNLIIKNHISSRTATDSFFLIGNFDWVYLYDDQTFYYNGGDIKYSTVGQFYGSTDNQDTLILISNLNRRFNKDTMKVFFYGTVPFTIEGWHWFNEKMLELKEDGI